MTHEYPGSTQVVTGWRKNLPEYMDIREHNSMEDEVVGWLGADSNETEQQYFHNEYYAAVIDGVMQLNNSHDKVFVDDFIEWVHDEGAKAVSVTVEEYEHELEIRSLI